MKKQMKDTGLAEELAAKVFNPQRLLHICETYNMEFDELMDMY